MKMASLVVSLIVASICCPTAGAQSRPETGFIDVGTARLYYEELGAGDPVVMIHGGLLDRRMWDGQFRVFAETHRAIRYDARGHGLSRAGNGSFSHHEDLKRLLDALKVEKAAIMGLSMGGYIAIDFALAYPDRVSALILAAPGLTGYKFDSEVLKKNNEALNKAARDNNLKMLVEYFQRSWTDGPARTPDQVDPAVREKVRQMSTGTLQNWNEESRESRLEPPAIGRLPEIQTPTLAVVGDLDMPDILEIVGLIEKNVKGARKVIIKGAAHMVNMERPAEFNRVVMDFLEER
jgi:pimeloyl-ACP methyl ester carboxylesterase